MVQRNIPKINLLACITLLGVTLYQFKFNTIKVINGFKRAKNIIKNSSYILKPNNFKSS
ncbi:hypothetical protein T190115A13A_160061 [Tenacibaculum sp. 190524A02b]|uniref:Uncharacterized protein n=1 Tax=Tenacibaculum vairaonense TaxID=3137860 RepID=A0ABP1F526_9FLAO